MDEQWSSESLALKKLRELKGLTRKQAGVMLGLGFKSVEKFENGRTVLNPSKVDLILTAYGYSRKDFEHILEGYENKVKNRNETKSPSIINNNELRRSYKRLITKEAQVLRVLRKIRGLSQYHASAVCGYSRPTIGHIENGRIELPLERIEHVVNSYAFNMKDFNFHKNSDVLITDVIEDCTKLIGKLDLAKLKMVKTILENFKS